MNLKSIPLFKVFMPDDIGLALQETLYSGHISEGPKVAEFEEKMGYYVGNPNLVATNSGSGALQLALQLADISGGEVISTPLTCQSTNQPVLQAGGKIVWSDIQMDTGNINPDDIRKKITDKTKAIIMMHWAGQPCDIDEINSIASSRGIKVIEDAASALGAEYKTKPIGSISDYTCFSFQAVKHITTGDGGALTLKNKHEYVRAILLRNHGNNKKARRTEISWDFDIIEPGWKFHMNDIDATIGLKQLDYANILLEKRRSNAKFLHKHLQNISGLECLSFKEDRKSACWIFPLLVKDREQFVRMIKSHGLHSSIVHQRNDIHTVFKDSRTELPNLDRFSMEMINISCGWWLSEEDLKYMVDVIKIGW
jgi:perosamine synthetase